MNHKADISGDHQDEPKALQQQTLTALELDAFVASTLKLGDVRRLRVEPLLFLEARPRKGATPPTGSASWVLRYTFAGIKTSRGLGSYVAPRKPKKNDIPGRNTKNDHKVQGVTLAQARELAQEARVLIARGVNPVEHKREGLQGAKQRHERTVLFAVEQWLAANKKKLTSPSYAAQKERRLREVLDYSDARHKVRRLGGMPVATVTTENVTDSLEVLLSRGTYETARRVLSDLEKSFNWARGKGWRADANPCSGVGVTIDKVDTVGHRAPGLVDLGDVVRGIRGVMNTGAGEFDYDARLTLLLLLTGARTGEIRLARWDEVIDLDGPSPRIDVPESRMKKRKEWTIPLSQQAAS